MNDGYLNSLNDLEKSDSRDAHVLSCTHLRSGDDPDLTKTTTKLFKSMYKRDKQTILTVSFYDVYSTEFVTLNNTVSKPQSCRL